MIQLFLKAKHWQLFLLVFGLPMIGQFFVVGSMIADITTGAPPDPSFMVGYFKFFPIMMVVFMGIFFGWFWAIAIGLQKKIPAHVKMKTSKFKIFFFIPFIYILLISIGFGVMMNGLMETTEAMGEAPDSVGVASGPAVMAGAITAIILPLHLFSMFCIFYCLYFVSKTLKTAELQRETTFSDFAGEFFMVWFYPIGIWIVQPRINKLAENDTPPG
jgi:hypothetical protein